jgi:hypothetical protein
LKVVLLGEGALLLQAAFAFKFELGKDACERTYLHLFLCECLERKKGNKKTFVSWPFKNVSLLDD